MEEEEDFVEEYLDAFLHIRRIGCIRVSWYERWNFSQNVHDLKGNFVQTTEAIVVREITPLE